MCVHLKRMKHIPIEPVEFEYTITRDESKAIVLIRPILEDGGLTNLVVGVEVLEVKSIWLTNEESATYRDCSQCNHVMREFLEELINHSNSDLAAIDQEHRSLLQQRIAIPCEPCF